MPRLSAFELFVGFGQAEIAFLEEKVLFYLRESMRTFVTQSKQNKGVGQDDEVNSNGRAFSHYEFRTKERGDSFGNDEEAKSMRESNPFGQLKKTKTLPRKSALPTRVLSSDHLCHVKVSSENGETKKMLDTLEPGKCGGAQTAAEPIMLFCETLLATMGRYINNFSEV